MHRNREVGLHSVILHNMSEYVTVPEPLKLIAV